MKKLESLKDKFGKFEMTKEEVKKVKGGANFICKKDREPEQLFIGYDSATDIAIETGSSPGTCYQL